MNDDTARSFLFVSPYNQKTTSEDGCDAVLTWLCNSMDRVAQYHTMHKVLDKLARKVYTGCMRVSDEMSCDLVEPPHRASDIITMSPPEPYLAEEYVLPNQYN